MKRVLFLTVLLASLFIIKNLLVSIYTLWQKQDLIVQTQHDLEREQKKNALLKKKVEETESSTFLEEQARNKLFLGKPGESQVLLPKNTLATDAGSQTKSEHKPTWLLWKELFF